MFRFLPLALLPQLPLDSSDCRPILMEQSHLLMSLQLQLPGLTIWPPSMEFMEQSMVMELDILQLPQLLDMLPMLAFVAHPNGAVVPVDEPAVAAARAEHFAAKAGQY